MRLLLVWHFGTWHDRPFPSPPLNWHRPAFVEARLQPDAELLRVPVARLQVWPHRCRLLRGAEDRRVPLQRAAQRREAVAEVAQRSAAAVLDVSVPRVPPHGAEECRRRGLRRHGAPGATDQQVPQRDRGSQRIRRVGALGAAGRLGIPPVFSIEDESRRSVLRKIFKDKTTRNKTTSRKTSIHLRRRHGCSLVAFDVLIESRLESCPAGSIESCHGSNGGLEESTACQHSTAARAKIDRSPTSSIKPVQKATPHTSHRVSIS